MYEDETQIITDILRREGSAFTNDPNDRGGATKYGITQHAWDDYVARSPSTAPTRLVESLTEPMARDFYSAIYVRPLGWIADLRLRELVIDCAVNHGMRRAVKWLQAAALVPEDGVVGLATRMAVNMSSSTGLHAGVLETRLKFYTKLAVDDPSQIKFLSGWINRACEFLS